MDWSFPFAFIWGFVIVAALAGWGTLVGPVQPNARSCGLGMAAALGASIFIFLSGWLLLFDWFSRAFVVVFIGLGMVFIVWAVFTQKMGGTRARPGDSGLRLVSGLAALVVLFFYCAGPCSRLINVYDDFPAYFVFPHIMLDTGSFLDPFSTRRLGTLGGQAALETLTFAVLPWKYGNLLDVGVGFLITIALVIDGVKGDSPWSFLAKAVLVSFASIFPIKSVNTHSEYTSVMLTLALLQTLDAVTRRESSGGRAALMLALLAGALATLRSQNFFAIGLILPAYFAFQLWLDKGERAQVLRLGLGTGAAALLFLCSWMTLSQLSSGTFLYPLIPGNQQPGFNLLNGKQSPAGLLHFLAAFFIGTKYILFLAPAFFIRDQRVRSFAWMLGGCFLLISVALVIKVSTANAAELYRYLMPLAFGFVLYSLTVAANEWIATADRAGWKMASPLVVVASFAVLLGLCERLYRPNLQGRIEQITAAFAPVQDYVPYGFPYIHPTPEVAGADYARGFSHVPAGASVLIAVDYPFMVDYRTHHIFNVDNPGVTSPPPGMPFFEGAGTLKAYLLNRGIEHIAYVPFDRGISLHGDAALQYLHKTNTLLTNQFAKYESDFMKNVDELAASNPVVYRSDFLCIVSLANPNASR